jgi:hypothetical protein
MKTRGAKRKEQDEPRLPKNGTVATKLPKPTLMEPPVCPEDQLAMSVDRNDQELINEEAVHEDGADGALEDRSTVTTNTTDGCDASITMEMTNKDNEAAPLAAAEDTVPQAFANILTTDETREETRPANAKISNENGQYNNEDGDYEADHELCFLIQDILDRNPKMVVPQLKAVQIFSIQDLVASKAKLIDAELPLKKRVCKELVNFCDHYEKHQETKPGEPWQERADEEWTSPLVQATAARSIKDPDLLYAYSKNTLHEGEQPHLAELTGNDFERMYELVADRVTMALSKKLKEACHFPVRENALRWIRAIFNLPSGKPYPRTFINSGRTQSGKTAVKAVVFAICLLLDINLFIITKGLQESRELYKKIQSYLDECGYEINPALGGDSLLMVGIENSSQIGKMISKMMAMRAKNPNRKFIVVNDECDSLYRTENSTQKMEIAHNMLMKLGPCLRLEISATPMPTIIILHKKGIQLELMKIGTSDDYSGIEEMEPFISQNGKEVYLPEKPGEIKEGVPYSLWNDGSRSWEDDNLQPDDNNPIFNEEFNAFDEPTGKFCSCHRLESIPYTTSEMMDFYKSACKPGKSKSGKKKRGVLVLDSTSPRVNVEANIFGKDRFIYLSVLWLYLRMSNSYPQDISQKKLAVFRMKCRQQ